MKFVYFNETRRLVSIHPATIYHGCEVNLDAIKPLEERVFTLPEGTYAHVRMWNMGENLEILVVPRSEADNNRVKHEPVSDNTLAKIGDSMIEHFVKHNPHNKGESNNA